MPNQRVAVITGGAMGIGAECAEQLAHHGLHVVIADRDTEAAAQTSSALIKAGLSASAVAIDVGDSTSIVAVLSEFNRHLAR